MKIAITGATGFLGRRLAMLLAGRGHEVVRLGRRPSNQLGWFAWDPESGPPPLQALEGADAVVHLAGEPVAQRWTPEVKRRIRRSRVLGTEELVQALTGLSRPPRVLVSASAIGYYGSRGDETLTETSLAGEGYLAEVCREWEQAALGAAAAGIRVVTPRIGIVLAAQGGALKQMLAPFRLGLGGPIAGGQAWMSWIHLDDLTAMLAWAIETGTVAGPMNAVAPHPVRNEVFTKALARTLRRPAFLPVPGFALKLLFGAMSEVVLASARVEPDAALQAGFEFAWPELLPALGDLLG